MPSQLRWEPDYHPVHRLIHLLDLLIVGFERNHASAVQKSAGTQDQLLSGFAHGWDQNNIERRRSKISELDGPRNQLLELRSRVLGIAPNAHVFADILAIAATAYIVQKGGKADEAEGAIRKAAEGLMSLCSRELIGVPNNPTFGPHAHGLWQDECKRLADARFSRQDLTRLLARVGEAIPDEILKGQAFGENLIEAIPSLLPDSRSGTPDHRERTTSPDSDIPEQLRSRAAVRELTPRINKLAEEFFARSEPLRIALNRMLAAAQDDWPEMLFESGKHFRVKPGESLMGSEPTDPDEHSPGQMARFVICKLAESAASADRKAFEKWREVLREEPYLANVAKFDRHALAEVLIVRSDNQHRAEFRGRLQSMLAEVGREFTWRTEESFARAGAHLTTVAIDAMRFWADFKDKIRTTQSPDRLLPPAGWRGSSLPEIVDRQEVSAKQPAANPVALGGIEGHDIDAARDANAKPAWTATALLAAPDIARHIGRNPKTVESLLRRYAEKHPDCRMETQSKRKNEPGFLYRTAEVWPVIDNWMKARTKD